MHRIRFLMTLTAGLAVVNLAAAVAVSEEPAATTRNQELSGVVGLGRDAVSMDDAALGDVNAEPKAHGPKFPGALNEQPAGRNARLAGSAMQMETIHTSGVVSRAPVVVHGFSLRPMQVK